MLKMDKYQRVQKMYWSRQIRILKCDSVGRGQVLACAIVSRVAKAVMAPVSALVAEHQVKQVPLPHVNPQPSTLNPQPSTLSHQPSTRNPQPSTLNPRPSTLNPQPSTLIPKPRTPDPRPRLYAGAPRLDPTGGVFLMSEVPLYPRQGLLDSVMVMETREAS